MTLHPILEGAQDWRPPTNAAAVFGNTHFATRAAERGVRSIPRHLLLWVVLEALQRGRTDLLEPVYEVSAGCTLYGLILPEGAFYPLIRGARP